jgi:ABC-type multidrug transport system ATPase subunit
MSDANNTAAVAPAIDLRDLVKEFGSVRAVDRVSLVVPRGSVYGLIGPNGAGKTTTFSIVAGYLNATGGTARVLGCEPTDVHALKGRVGVLPQDAMLPANESVGDFLVYLARLQGIASDRAEAASREALQSVGGMEWWTMRCGKLSHGMAKRVGIAQAILGSPELVLLDEPTAGLDPKVAYQLRQFIRGLGGKHTVVVSSHNLAELEEVCDGAAILDRGKLVSAGSLTALTGASEEFRVTISPGPFGIEGIRAIQLVRSAEFDPSNGTLVVHFDPKAGDAETVIAAVLRVLLDQGARIAGLAKGRKLEQRVMELT